MLLTYTYTAKVVEDVFGIHRAVLEGLAGVGGTNAGMASGLYGGRFARLLGLGIQHRRAVSRGYRDPLQVPSRFYGGAASPDEAGEDDYVMREENGGQEMALADGTVVSVREVRSEDAPALQRLVDRLSERSIYLRFFGPMNRLSDKKARHFAEVDGSDRYALVALDPEEEDEIVAIVRFDRKEGTDRAEYAALVEDRLQGKGLGIGLTRALVEAARERDIRNLDALVLPENSGMVALLKSLDLPEKTQRKEGVKHVSVDLFPEN